MKATRDGFGDELVECGKSNEKLVVLSADLSKATKTGAFARAHPDRFIECGIAEANMIGIASGLSEHGHRVFMSSFGAFLTGRYDIIRCSLAYPNRPVVLVGTHSGMAIGKDGNTQMGIEDVNLMRGMPNMKVYQPSTYSEAREITRHLVNSNELAYLRIGRQPVEDSKRWAAKFVPGKPTCLTQSKKGDVLLMYSGCVAELARSVAAVLRNDHELEVGICNFHTIKPLDKEFILGVEDAWGMIVTIEDHSVIGGLGTAVAEVLADAGSSRQLHRFGIEDTFAESGVPSDLYEKHGLRPHAIVERIRKAW